MAYPEILGMDPLTFLLTIASALGVLFSGINFIRHYTPTNVYIKTADSVAQTRALFDLLESENLFSTEQISVKRIEEKLNFLDDELKSLTFVLIPPSSILQRLRNWLKVRELLELSRNAEKLRIGIQTVSDHKKRNDRTVDRAQRQGVTVDVRRLEADVVATAGMFISSLEGRASEVSATDLELNAPRCNGLSTFPPGRQYSDSDSATIYSASSRCNSMEDTIEALPKNLWPDEVAAHSYTHRPPTVPPKSYSSRLASARSIRSCCSPLPP